jgi:hypothetical protein
MDMLGVADAEKAALIQENRRLATEVAAAEAGPMGGRQGGRASGSGGMEQDDVGWQRLAELEAKVQVSGGGMHDLYRVGGTKAGQAGIVGFVCVWLYEICFTGQHGDGYVGNHVLRM